MTQAIIEDKEKEKEIYEFLEDDDDYEEFENDELDYDAVLGAGGDVEMIDSNAAGVAKKDEEGFDKKLW